jgi:DNA-binding GntR family transcriptional regulator
MANEFKTIQEVIFNTLKKRITSGEYEPGKRLIAKDLAEEFDISRMPVREALTRLASTGLVELIPYKGAVVNELTEKDYMEIFSIRSVLEGLAARLACPNMREEDLEKMRAANDEIKSMIEEDDVEFQRVNRLFHSTIWQRTNSERLTTLLTNLYSEAAQYRHLTMIHPGRMIEVHKEHEEFLTALYERDAKKAEESVRKHYESTLQWLVEFFKSSEEKRE